MIDLPVNKKVVIFDGVCNLCNSFINLIIKYDSNNRFVFTSLQSEISQEITSHLKIDSKNKESIFLYEQGVSYDFKSTAALKIMKEFGGLWYLTQVGYILPQFLRDGIYDIVAKNRYKWFGKRDICMIPSAETKSKFLD